METAPDGLYLLKLVMITGFIKRAVSVYNKFCKHFIACEPLVFGGSGCEKHLDFFVLI